MSSVQEHTDDDVHGCTVCRGCMDAEERLCTWIYCMPWLHVAKSNVLADKSRIAIAIFRAS